MHPQFLVYITHAGDTAWVSHSTICDTSTVSSVLSLLPGLVRGYDDILMCTGFSKLENV